MSSTPAKMRSLCALLSAWAALLGRAELSVGWAAAARSRAYVSGGGPGGGRGWVKASPVECSPRIG
eukprot:1234941-Heterocapsa_arctica.AAC.1